MTLAPAATYSTACTAVALLTWTIAVNDAVAVPSTPMACTITAPAVCGVTIVDAMPCASVCTVQLAVPHVANSTLPAVVANATASPTTGVIPSAFKTCTAKGIAIGCSTICVPEGAVNKLSVVVGAA